MFTLKSNRIEDFPFECYADLNLSDLQEQAQDHHLNSYNSWMLPQIVAHLATYQLYYKDNGRICQQQTLIKNVNQSDLWSRGLWRVITKLKRSSLVKQQSLPGSTNYSALVPLYWSAQKRYNGVKYSQWSVEEDKNWMLEDSLAEVLCWTPDPDSVCNLDYSWDQDQLAFGIPHSRLLELRQIGLPKTGTKRDNPTSNWCLRNTRLTELKNMPKLMTTMLAQIWVAHPTLRTQLMILDPNHWDLMPEPLVDWQPINHTKTKKEPDIFANLPWNTTV
jgi:hypothetical protein